MTSRPTLRLSRLLARRRPFLLAVAAFLLGLWGMWIGLSASEAADLEPARLLAEAPPAAGAALPSQAIPWPLNPQGELLAHRLLRQRFDRLLASAGDSEAALAVARDTLALEAQTELGPMPAAEVLRIWDAYLNLQRRRWQVPVDLQRISTWDEALAERQRVRRELLGEEWAQAFYGEDERLLRSWMDDQRAGQAQP
ncbi:MAG: hypothetical protein J0L58_12815 [Burkholderiales bacterium]|nr:hypothetical protein [Burkholderiales bacterium]